MEMENKRFCELVSFDGLAVTPISNDFGYFDLPVEGLVSLLVCRSVEVTGDLAGVVPSI